MTHADLVEKVAEAEYLAHPLNGRNQPWANLDQYQKAAWIRSARAAISECYRALVQPTPEMISAVREEYWRKEDIMDFNLMFRAGVSASSLNGGAP